jgi:hypothetical protein
MSVVREISDCHFTGMPPDGQSYIVLGEDVQRLYGLPVELLPDCPCGAPTVVDSVIKGKYFYARRWPLKHVWCLHHVPWWIHAAKTFRRWMDGAPYSRVSKAVVVLVMRSFLRAVGWLVSEVVPAQALLTCLDRDHARVVAGLGVSGQPADEWLSEKEAEEEAAEPMIPSACDLCVYGCTGQCAEPTVADHIKNLEDVLFAESSPVPPTGEPSPATANTSAGDQEGGESPHSPPSDSVDWHDLYAAARYVDDHAAWPGKPLTDASRERMHDLASRLRTAAYTLRDK